MTRSTRTNDAPLDSGDIPQANDVRRVLEVVRGMAAGEAYVADLLGLDSRDLAHHRHAATLLGWLTPYGTVTAEGERALSDTSGSMRAVRTTKVMRAWVSWARLSDPDSSMRGTAQPFLAECADVLAETRERRAATLERWLEVALSRSEAPSSEREPRRRRHAISRPAVGRAESSINLRTDGDEFAALMVSVHRLPLPTRMLNWCARNDVELLSQLVQHLPADLSREKNVGRRTIGATKAVILKRTGRDWLTWAALTKGVDASSLERGEDGVHPSWRLNAALNDEQLSTKLDSVPAFPARLGTVARRLGLETVSDLLAQPPRRLMEEPGFGRKTRRDVEVALDALGRGEAGPTSLGRHDSLHGTISALLGDCDARARLVIEQRSGLNGEPLTLKEIGEALEISGERVRQIEASVMDQWTRIGVFDALGSRLDATCGDGGIALDDLFDADPWLGDAEWDAGLLEYLLPRLDPPRFIVQIGREDIVGPHPQKTVEGAIAAADIELKRLSFPLAVASVRSAVMRVVGGVLGALSEFIVDVAMTRLVVTDGVATGLGSTRRQTVMRWLRNQPSPVRRSVLERQFGNVPLADDVLVFDQGLVGTRRHFPDFDTWRERLVPRVIEQLMGEPKQRMHCAELLPQVVDPSALPPGFNHWWLAMLCREDPRVEYLGRSRVGLPQDEQGPLTERPMVVLRAQVLAAGEPIARDELYRRVRHVVPESTDIDRLVTRPPLCVMPERRVGLVSRDVRGGLEALLEAGEALTERLEMRRRPLSKLTAHAIVRGLGGAQSDWPIEHVVTAVAYAPQLVLEPSGDLTLAAWRNPRERTPRATVERLLSESSGAAPLTEVLEAIADAHGFIPTGGQLSPILAAARAVRRGEEVVFRASLDVHPVASESRVMLSDDLERFVGSLDTDTQWIVRSLLRDPAANSDKLDPTQLTTEVENHVARFELAADVLGGVSLTQAREIAARCKALLRGWPRLGGTERQVASAAIRYFALVRDAENDFAPGGLDDDFRVLTAAERWVAGVAKTG